MVWILIAIVAIGFILLVINHKKNGDPEDSLSLLGWTAILISAFMAIMNVTAYCSSYEKLEKFQEYQAQIDYLRTRPMVEQVGIGEAIIKQNSIRTDEIEDLEGFWLSSITPSRWAETKPLK